MRRSLSAAAHRLPRADYGHLANLLQQSHDEVRDGSLTQNASVSVGILTQFEFRDGHRAGLSVALGFVVICEMSGEDAQDLSNNGLMLTFQGRTELLGRRLDAAFVVRQAIDQIVRVLSLAPMVNGELF